MMECESCENEIESGDEWLLTDEGTKHEACVLHDSLFDKYHFYITNPAHKDGHAFSMWRVYDEKEHPVLAYSEGIMTVNSSSIHYSGSDAIEPSDAFFNAVAHAVHSVLSFYPAGVVGGETLENRVEEEKEAMINVFYDTEPPEHEEMFIGALVYQLLPHTFPYVISELKPIRDYADGCTGFSVPDVHPALEE